MARHWGEWDERREGRRDWERRDERRWAGEPWRDEEGDWRANRGPGEGGYGDRDRGWRGSERERWDEPGRGRPYGGEWPGERRPSPEIDPPWVEMGPRARRHADTRGLVEWEDRGPLSWLGDRMRDRSAERPRAPKGYKRSDERICDDVCERISRSGVDAHDVEVKVQEGEVTLTGTVPSRAERWRLEEVADGAFGVTDVRNDVRVARPEEPSMGQPGPGVRGVH